MSVDAVVFDLDGTLWDTTESCAVAWNTVLARHAIPFREIVADDVRRVTGMPHAECIRATFVGLAEEQIRRLIEETGTEDNEAILRLGGTIYPGVQEGLRQLAERYRLFIVSNCQAGYIETFLEYSGFGAWFEDFECVGNTGHPKPENLRRVIERNRLEHPVMVGDTHGDREAAEFCGVPFVHATYGFGRVPSARHTIDAFADLAPALRLFE